MGQKANPIGQRLGLIKGWDSNWYGGDNYADKLVEDEKIRQYLMARLKKASVARIIIERTLKLVTVTINTARPGVIIGRGGTEVDKLREELKKFTGKDVQINIFEIKRPELDARLVADSIARQLEGRISFRRAMKMSVASTMRMGVAAIFLAANWLIYVYSVETGQVQLRRFGHQRQAGLRGVGVGIEAELVQPLLQPVQRQRAGGCQDARRLRQVGVEYGQCRVDAGFFP